MIKIYQNKKNRFFIGLFLFTFGLCSNSVVSQTTIISTEAGTNYTGTSGIVTGPGAITFVIQNTNAFAVTLKQVDLFLLTNFNNTVPKLWYSASSLSGAPTITTPNWTLIATGSAVPVPAPGAVYLPILTGLSFNIPANTQYRFAVETSLGIGYTSAAAGPSPDEFTTNGVTLKVGTSQIAGADIGWGGAMPSPVNTPRYFTGRVTLCTSTNNATVPVLSPDTLLCGGASADLRVTGGSLNDAANWRWYTGSCGGTAAGTGASITVSPATTTTYFVRGEGGCAAANGPCASVTVTKRQAPGTPTIAAVAPICDGSLAALTIDPLAITPGSVTVNSAALNLNIPDNIATGANTTLAIAGVPAGATITGMDITLNMTHTYIGDMIFNLRAPNGQILNLAKYLTLTGNEGADFLNTVISSDGVNPLSTGTQPFTGTFKADALNGAFGANPVVNPTGFVSTAAAFANLYSTPNGTYTLAMADGGPADLGILKGWIITIRYTTSAAAFPAVWTPFATLYTDINGTIPYDGITPRFQVFAKPATLTTYSASSILNGCYSAPADVTVTVNNKASITTQPVSKVVCQANATSFVVAASGTRPTFQWQTNKGTNTFTNIVNDANYSGATDDTLVIKNVPASWNSYKYICIVTSVAPCTTIVTSDTVTLTVNPKPTVTLSAGTSSTSLLPGMTANLVVSSTPAAASYSWIKNSLPFTGATGASFDAIVDDQGIYAVEVTDINGCVNTSNSLEVSDSVSSKLFIYPNPASGGQFSVSYYSLKGNILPRALTIYDSKGALVLKQIYSLTKPYDKMNVDFSGLSKGMYMVNLLDRAGNRIATGKVITQ